MDVGCGSSNALLKQFVKIFLFMCFICQHLMVWKINDVVENSENGCSIELERYGTINIWMAGAHWGHTWENTLFHKCTWCCIHYGILTMSNNVLKFVYASLYKWNRIWWWESEYISTFKIFICVGLMTAFMRCT